MARITAAEVESIPLGRPAALRPHMQAITLEVILRVVIGTREPERLEPLRRALSRLTGMHPIRLLAATMVRRDLGPGSPWRTFISIRDEADELLYEEIARRRARPGGDDMLSMLVEARDEDGNGLDDRALRDELVTLLLAGHETTATGLAWAFERLVRHPEAMARLRETLDAGDDSLPRRGDQGDAAGATGRARGGAAPDGAGGGGRVPPARGDDGDVVGGAPPALLRSLARAGGFPSRAFPRQAARRLHVDPVRRRSQALPGGELRPPRDAGRHARVAAPARTAPPRGPSRSAAGCGT
jgi:hypothetical protein